MAYAPGFDYDIFISYSHKDNQSIGTAGGWVDQFHRQLVNSLQRRELANLAIWRDENLTGNTLFDDSIQDKIRKSALFLALHSRSYRKSTYCTLELDLFHKYNGDRPNGLRVGDKLRILNVLLNNIPLTEWSPALGKTSGFVMHDAPSNIGSYGDFLLPSDERFLPGLRKIADAIEITLNAFAKTEPPPIVANKAEERGVVVFLADAADSLQRLRDRVAADLISNDIEVIQDIPPPMDNAAHEQAVKQVLETASLSVHMFDQYPGRRVVDKKDTTYPRRQAEIALASSIPSIVWTPSELPASSSDMTGQQEWLQQLEEGTREGKHYEFMRCGETTMIQNVLQSVAALRSPSPRSNGSYLIDTHQKDQEYAYSLATLLSREGVDVDLNKESHDPTESLLRFERSVTSVRGLIIMCGKVAGAWVNGRIQRAVKVVVEQFQADNPQALENIWVLLLPGGGAVTKPKLPGVIRVTLLDNSHSNEFDRNVIKPLFPNGGPPKPAGGPVNHADNA